MDLWAHIIASIATAGSLSGIFAGLSLWLKTEARAAITGAGPRVLGTAVSAYLQHMQTNPGDTSGAFLAAEIAATNYLRKTVSGAAKRVGTDLSDIGNATAKQAHQIIATSPAIGDFLQATATKGVQLADSEIDKLAAVLTVRMPTFMAPVISAAQGMSEDAINAVGKKVSEVLAPTITTAVAGTAVTAAQAGAAAAMQVQQHASEQPSPDAAQAAPQTVPAQVLVDQAGQPLAPVAG